MTSRPSGDAIDEAADRLVAGLELDEDHAYALVWDDEYHALAGAKARRRARALADRVAAQRDAHAQRLAIMAANHGMQPVEFEDAALNAVLWLSELAQRGEVLS